MATKIGATPVTKLATTVELQTQSAVHGAGAPSHTPTVGFQIYTDESTGKTYLWIVNKWY